MYDADAVAIQIDADCARAEAADLRHQHEAMAELLEQTRALVREAYHEAYYGIAFEHGKGFDYNWERSLVKKKMDGL